MKKKVTIQDIADALGISRNTVSKAINNSEGLADATREKILQKAVEMGYKQFSYFSTFAAVSDAGVGGGLSISGYQGEIALLTSAFLTQSHFASTMLDKFQGEIAQLGYTMNTHRVTSANLKEKSLPLSFRPDQVKAIICIEMFDRAYDEMVCELGLPVLFVDGPAKWDGFSLPADQLYMDIALCGRHAEPGEKADRLYRQLLSLPVLLRALRRLSLRDADGGRGGGRGLLCLL